MIRVEVIANRSVQEDFFEAIAAADAGRHYTLFPEVHGDGAAGPRRGDHIWPEENFVYVCYTGIDEARTIHRIVEDLRERFPEEGIRIFATQGIDLG